MPIEVDATTRPEALTERSEFVRPLIHVVPKVARVDDEFEKFWSPVQVLLFARSVEDAAVIVMDPPLLNVVPLMVPREPVKRLVPIEDVATTLPVESTPSTAEARLVKYALPETVSAVDEAYVVSRLVAQPRVIVARELEELAKFWRPVQVLLFAKSVEEAAVMVADPPAVITVPFTVARVPERRLVPIVVLATICPCAFVESNEFASDDIHVVPRVVSVEEEFAKFWRPVHVLLLARSVEEAAVIVISAVPLKLVPLMLRAV